MKFNKKIFEGLSDEEIKEIYAVLRSAGYEKSIEVFKEDLNSIEEKDFFKIPDGELSCVAGGSFKQYSTKAMAAMLIFSGVMGNFLPAKAASGKQVSQKLANGVKNAVANPKVAVTTLGLAGLSSAAVVAATWGLIKKLVLTRDLVFDKLSDNEEEVLKKFLEDEKTNIYFSGYQNELKKLFEKIKDQKINSWEDFSGELKNVVESVIYFKQIKGDILKTEYKGSNNDDLLRAMCKCLLELNDKNYVLAASLAKISSANFDLINEPLKLANQIYEFLNQKNIKLENNEEGNKKREKHLEAIKKELKNIKGIEEIARPVRRDETVVEEEKKDKKPDPSENSGPKEVVVEKTEEELLLEELEKFEKNISDSIASFNNETQEFSEENKKKFVTDYYTRINEILSPYKGTRKKISDNNAKKILNIFRIIESKFADEIIDKTGETLRSKNMTLLSDDLSIKDEDKSFEINSFKLEYYKDKFKKIDERLKENATRYSELKQSLESNDLHRFIEIGNPYENLEEFAKKSKSEMMEINENMRKDVIILRSDNGKVKDIKRNFSNPCKSDDKLAEAVSLIENISAYDKSFGSGKIYNVEFSSNGVKDKDNIENVVKTQKNKLSKGLSNEIFGYINNVINFLCEAKNEAGEVKSVVLPQNFGLKLNGKVESLFMGDDCENDGKTLAELKEQGWTSMANVYSSGDATFDSAMEFSRELYDLALRLFTDKDTINCYISWLNDDGSSDSVCDVFWNKVFRTKETKKEGVSFFGFGGTTKGGYNCELCCKSLDGQVCVNVRKIYSIFTNPKYANNLESVFESMKKLNELLGNKNVLNELSHYQ